MRALTANRETPAVPQTAIRTHFDEPLHVHGDLLAEISFDRAFILEQRTNTVYFFFAQILDLPIDIDTDTVKDRSGTASPDAIDVGQADFSPLSRRQINACNTRHIPLCSYFSSLSASLERLALTLLVLRIHADDANYAFAVDNLALVTHFLNGCPYFHVFVCLFLRQQPDDAPAGPIVRGYHYFHTISRPQPHKISDYRASDMRRHFLLVF